MRLLALDFYEVKLRANNLIVLEEFLLKFTSKNGFQLCLDILITKLCALKRSLGLNCHLKLKLCACASNITIIATFLKAKKQQISFI